MEKQTGHVRPRGRARGRSRGQETEAKQFEFPPSQQQPAPHARPVTNPNQVVPPGGIPGGAAPVGRAKSRSRGRSPVEMAVRRKEQRGQQVPSMSRGSYHGAEKAGEGRQATQQSAVEGIIHATGAVKIDNGSSSGNGEEHGRSVGRGVMRGKRDIGRIIWTKPETITVKRGTVGQAIYVLTNYFNLIKKQDWKLCLYHVDFSPEEDRTPERKRLLRQHREALKENYLFDGMQLYLPFKLGSEITELASKRESDQSVYQVKIKFIKELKPMDSQYLQIMNIILRRCLEYMGLQTIGRNYYNPKAELRDERHRIAIWPGYSTSIRQHENSLLLNVDVMHKFLRSETAYEAIRRCRGNMRVEAPKVLLGAVVMTKYNEKTYRVDDIDWNVFPTSTFPYKGGEISYLDYYQQNYQVRIKDVQQPMLLSKPKKRDLRRGSGNIYLVPELCVMTGLSDLMRSDFNMMKDLAQYMRMAPDKRVQTLLRFNHDLASNEKVKQEMTHWGLQVDSSLMQVQGRLLPEEYIIQGGENIRFNRRTADWSKETRSTAPNVRTQLMEGVGRHTTPTHIHHMEATCTELVSCLSQGGNDIKVTASTQFNPSFSGKKQNVPVDLNNWAVVHPVRVTDDAHELLSALQRVASPMGMKIMSPTMYGLHSDSAQDYVNVINKCTGKQLVLAILPNDRADRYSAIKRHLSIKMGIPSQCILSRTIFKKQRLMSVATKVAIQINCKLGGEPWNVHIPIKNAMVIGYDAFHDKAKRGSSYGAVVSSLNQPWTRYLSQVANHANQEELADNFATGVRNALNHYKMENGQQPNMVVVYRDGVGEGQIEYVKEHEIAAIKRCFDETCEHHPKFAFIIVSKRINTRVFLDSRGHIDNPPPGTVVDDVITLPERYDFFLVSQSINQGTVSPTSFNIIEDTTGLKPDHMQRLAYKLTHLYFNWQGTVRVPAPCMFAHKLAFMTGQSINGPPHRNLIDRLWYL